MVESSTTPPTRWGYDCEGIDNEQRKMASGVCRACGRHSRYVSNGTCSRCHADHIDTGYLHDNSGNRSERKGTQVTPDDVKWVFTAKDHYGEYPQAVTDNRQDAVTIAEETPILTLQDTCVKGGWYEPVGFKGWLIRNVGGRSDTLQPVPYYQTASTEEDDSEQPDG